MWYGDAYEELANAIIFKAMEDYLTYSRGYYRYKKKYEKELRNPTYVPPVEGETEDCYKKRKQRHSATHYLNKMDTYKICAETARNFFKGNWIKTISTIDGEVILKTVEEKLEKEGHRITWD